jgi:hypothetical protein
MHAYGGGVTSCEEFYFYQCEEVIMSKQNQDQNTNPNQAQHGGQQNPGQQNPGQQSNRPGSQQQMETDKQNQANAGNQKSGNAPGSGDTRSNPSGGQSQNRPNQK